MSKPDNPPLTDITLRDLFAVADFYARMTDPQLPPTAIAKLWHAAYVSADEGLAARAKEADDAES